MYVVDGFQRMSLLLNLERVIGGSNVNNLTYLIMESLMDYHYYILCLFAKGQTKNLKGLRSKNKKPEGFAKQKQKT
jgi:hypothetical protein